jgi:allantoin racemase
MKIRVIAPVTMRWFAAKTLEQYAAAARPDTEVSVVSIDRGPVSIESRCDKALAAPDTLAKAIEAEKEGVDAVICNCMCDTAVQEARELLSIPVIGPGETAMHVAALLGHRFSVIDILESWIPVVEQQAIEVGVERQLASVRAVNIPVAELRDEPRVVAAMVEQSAKAITEDGAHVIIFGCTGMAGLAGHVGDGLRSKGITGVPVIDPAVIALKMAEALVDMGLSHSKRTYPVPPRKDVVGYPGLP